MDNFPKISVPVPCDENWNDMSIVPNGRFCASCVRNVIDFSSKSNAEIHNYLYQNRGTEVCGRFRINQVEGLKIQIPESVFFRKMPFHRAFLLVLFATMGSILFSCSTDDGAKQNIDSVDIVSDDRMAFTSGMVWIPEYYVAEEPEADQYQPLFYEDAADYDWAADTVAYMVDSVAVEEVSLDDQTDTLSRPDSEE